MRTHFIHSSRSRQPLVAILFFGLFAAVTPAPAETPEDPAAQDLRAVKALELAAEIQGDSPDQKAKLVRIFDSLVAKYPKNSAVRTARGEFLWSIDQPDHAVQDWQTAAQLDPKNAEALNHLGNCALDAGEIQRCADFYERAATAGPDNALYHFNLANVLCLFRNDLTEGGADTAEKAITRALAQYAEAARLDPQNETYLRSYAETFYLLKKPDWRAALFPWEQYRQVSPHKEFALTNLARIHLKLGEKTAALACLEEIHTPEFAHLKATLEAQCKQE